MAVAQAVLHHPAEECD